MVLWMKQFRSILFQKLRMMIDMEGLPILKLSVTSGMVTGMD